MGFLMGDQTGVAVPGSDVFRLPDGSYAPMTPMQIFMKDLMSPFSSGYTGTARDTLETDRNKLKKALDDASKGI